MLKIHCLTLICLSCIGVQVMGRGIGYDEPVPPPIEEAAKMARFIVHFTDWGTLAHISLQNSTFSYPIARVYSISDGPITISSGIPYIYLPLIDEGVQDLLHSNKCSVTTSLGETKYCTQKSLDIEDPRCPQVILTGKCEFVPNGTAEWDFAEEALFSRHPPMKKWPKGHRWQILKPNIENILLVDNIGGNKYPSVAEYFAPSSDPLKSRKKFGPIIEVINLNL